MRVASLVAVLLLTPAIAQAQDAVELELGGETHSIALADVRNITFSDDGSASFALSIDSSDWLATRSARHVGKTLTIRFGENVVAQPRIRSPLRMDLLPFQGDEARPLRRRLLQMVNDWAKGDR